MTEDEMVGWHHRLNRHECEQASGDTEGQGRPGMLYSWDCKELDTTQQPNNSLSELTVLRALGLPEYLSNAPQHTAQRHSFLFACVSDPELAQQDF